MPRLRILAGPSLDELVPIEANSGVPLHIKSDVFEGQILVYIKGFADTNGDVGDSSYFEQKERKGITWSIQVQGRFLQPHNADDVLFGNVFDRPLKLPWGFSAALKFMKYIDPTLEQDLTSNSKPWALSPLVATMPHLEHRRIDETHHPPPFPPKKPIADDISHLPVHSHKGKAHERKPKRRAYFHHAARRKEVKFGPEDLLTTDFCYDYLEFSPEGVVLRLPVGISIDMLRYWDGQPVRFVCCERIPKGSTRDGVPWGRVFWCVVIESAEDEHEKGVR
ncbi:unnamed protein product [Somion occarium]|uniref:Domain of unknown function at the cortex 1 domain-containing protein n=1 Tax=Somion occarium TaxID=3059160 RepID=A0ABP1CVE8_9APHY